MPPDGGYCARPVDLLVYQLVDLLVDLVDLLGRSIGQAGGGWSIGSSAGPVVMAR